MKWLLGLVRGWQLFGRRFLALGSLLPGLLGSVSLAMRRLAFGLVWSKVTHRANAPLLFDNPGKSSHHQGAKARREGQGQRVILNVGF
jgi:hypothetical protein